LERSYPEKRYFVLEAAQKQLSRPTQPASASCRLTICESRHDTPTEGFVYRISEAGYETDFYNQFLTATDVMIGEEVRRGLAASQSFKICRRTLESAATQLCFGRVD
jgi:hypothetical protein